MLDRNITGEATHCRFEIPLPERRQGLLHQRTLDCSLVHRSSISEVTGDIKLKFPIVYSSDKEKAKKSRAPMKTHSDLHSRVDSIDACIGNRRLFVFCEITADG
jgi:hypothetical protein